MAPGLLNDLRYSARSLARTPALAVALVLSVALGIGSNAAVHGFVRGSIRRDLPLPDADRVVSILGGDPARSGALTYDDYLSLQRHHDPFEWVGAARESLNAVGIEGRVQVLPAAEITPEIAALFQLPWDAGVVISSRLQRSKPDDWGKDAAARLQIDGSEARVGGLAPDRLEGLYLGRPVDIWKPLDDAEQSDGASAGRTVWVFARLRDGVSIARAEALINGGRGEAGLLRVQLYTGLTPDMASGLANVSLLLRAAAVAVFLIACANVASLLLSRASARSHETSVRVALGARRAQLARQLLCDSALISLTGGAFGVLLVKLGCPNTRSATVSLARGALYSSTR